MTADRVDHVKDELLARGFCVVRAVISLDDIAAVKRRLRYIAAHAPFYASLGVYFTPAPAAAPRDRDDPLARFEQIGNVPFLDTECRRRLLAHPRFMRVVEAVLGHDCYVINAGFFLKPARRGAEVPWHQDAATWGVLVGAWSPSDAPLIFDYWLALDPTDRDNGCLELLPDSHRRGILPHARRGGLVPEADPAAFGFDPAQRLAIPAAPGDLVIYHQDMFHRSDRNLSARPRLAAAGTFIGRANVERLRALLPNLPTLEHCPIHRDGRPVEPTNPLPRRASLWGILRWRLARGWRSRPRHAAAGPLTE